jgi:hypothetical protein
MSEDNQKLRERFVVVREEFSNTIFQMINPLRGECAFSFLWNEEEAARKAKMLARFYKELIDGGFEKEMAWQMTQKMMTYPDELIKEYFLKSLDVAKEVAEIVAKEQAKKDATNP